MNIQQAVTATSPAAPATPTASPHLTVKQGTVYANSRDVAKYFEKRHDHVLADIDALLPETREQAMFAETTTEIRTGFGTRPYRTFDMTRDGFALLAMGFTGPKALRFKIAYIEAFNRMEKSLAAEQGEQPPIAESSKPEQVAPVHHDIPAALPGFTSPEDAARFVAELVKLLGVSGAPRQAGHCVRQ